MNLLNTGSRDLLLYLWNYSKTRVLCYDRFCYILSSTRNRLTETLLFVRLDIKLVIKHFGWLKVVREDDFPIFLLFSTVSSFSIILFETLSNIKCENVSISPRKNSNLGLLRLWETNLFHFTQPTLVMISLF